MRRRRKPEIIVHPVSPLEIAAIVILAQLIAVWIVFAARVFLK